MLKLAIAAALTASASAAQATTVIIYVEPMTMERYTRVFDTPGPDRFLMCPAPPAAGSCTELPIKHRR
jgi:hypothetical protein